MNDKNSINKKEINNSEINDTEALMNQLDLLSFTEDKSFDDLTLFQKSKSNIKTTNKELINNFYLNALHLKENDILLTLGAGNVWQQGEELLKHIEF